MVRDVPPERGSPVIEQYDSKQVEDNFATALRQSRENSGLSQSRLAARAGYDHSYVSRLESDTRAPTRDAVLSLGNAMGLAEVERDYLLAAAGFLPLRRREFAFERAGCQRGLCGSERRNASWRCA